MAVIIDRDLLTRIDALELSQRNIEWRNTMKSSPWRLSADRERWTVKSWRETEGEDLQLRRAKLVGCVLDNIEIEIHPFDEIVGRPTPWAIGCCTSIDVNSDYIQGLFDASGAIDLTTDASVVIDAKSASILHEAVQTFSGKTMREATYRAWREIVGSWAEDAESAKLKDPSLDSTITGQSTSTLSWNKILRVGLRGYIDEAKSHIARFIERGDVEISKLHFWQSAIIVLEAVIQHARRYAALARDKAETADE